MPAPCRRRCGMSLSELLVVISILIILAAMLSPLLLSGLAESKRQQCAGNMRQVGVTLGLIRNANHGKLPACFDLVPGTTTVDESTWWFIKASALAYGPADPLLLPRSAPFPPERYVLRCPASPDPPDDTHAPSSLPKCYELVKDRVYDNNYACNNMGFDYMPSVRTIGVPDGPNAVPTSYLYHLPNAAGFGGRTPMEPIRGQFLDTATSTNIGASADIADPAATILLMDYVKADAQPFPGVDDLLGYRFRHHGKANVLSVDGHVEGYHKADFLRQVGGPTLHWEVRRSR